MIARCTCGSVEYEATGSPILSVVCYCADCQEGSRRLEALPNAPPIRDPDGGTAYVLYRRDRVRCIKGGELVNANKLKPKTATNRVVANCCNSAMVMTFDDSKHWIPVYRGRLKDAAPPVDMRICTKFAPDGSKVPRDVPTYLGFSVRFLGKLLRARIAMLLGR